jgi:hypothetical protein
MTTKYEIGDRVCLYDHHGLHRGRVQTLTPAGVLYIDWDDGSFSTIDADDVEPEPADSGSACSTPEFLLTFFGIVVGAEVMGLLLPAHSRALSIGAMGMAWLLLGALRPWHKRPRISISQWVDLAFGLLLADAIVASFPTMTDACETFVLILVAPVIAALHVPSRWIQGAPP